jgi:hypothetical protein
MRFGIEMFGGPPAVQAAQVTDDFIAVSESVGRDLRQTLHVPAEKITVIQTRVGSQKVRNARTLCLRRVIA